MASLASFQVKHAGYRSPARAWQSWGMLRKERHRDRREPESANQPATESARGSWTWAFHLQRTAGNRAVVAALANQPQLQRTEPSLGAAPTSGSREPNKSEIADWAGYVDSQPFRIVRSQESGYNCFAWALGSTSGSITYATLAAAGFGPDLTGFTGYLTTVHGFARHADGLDRSADLILYGSTEMVEHAARKADEPFGTLTFSSKLGGDYDATPVILHEPGVFPERFYGKPLRSFWRTAAEAVETSKPERRFKLFPGRE